jgi:hypothetical protein
METCKILQIKLILFNSYKCRASRYLELVWESAIEIKW